jgi:hypothetical protein
LGQFKVSSDTLSKAFELDPNHGFRQEVCSDFMGALPCKVRGC